ncbi:MAG: hypothetical protein ACYC5Q_13325 [Thermoleophilia bacterium]
MQVAVGKKLRRLNTNYADVTGRAFAHFFCPILFRDEEAELCKAHIINVAFKGRKPWTVQRKDVDNFYGSMFESDFVDLRHKERELQEIVSNPALIRRFRPSFSVNGRTIESYHATGLVPPCHTQLADGTGKDTHVVLKIDPSEMSALANAKWQVSIDKDLRLPSLVSILKAAHLTMFEMVGYEYALSSGGYFVGREILGDFFLANVGRPRPEVAANALTHFSQFVHMVRPVVGTWSHLDGTIHDRKLYVLKDGKVTWGAVVFVRAASSLHAALLPVFQDDAGAERFAQFLLGSRERLEARHASYEGDHWRASTKGVTLDWPKTGTLLMR